MNKLTTIIIIMMLCSITAIAQYDPPSAYTPNYGLRLWNEGARPGSDSVNMNLRDIDRYLNYNKKSLDSITHYGTTFWGTYTFKQGLSIGSPGANTIGINFINEIPKLMQNGTPFLSYQGGWITAANIMNVAYLNKNNLYSGQNVFNGETDLMGVNIINGYASLAGENTFSSSNIFNGTVSLLGINTIVGYAPLAGNNTFTSLNTFSGTTRLMGMNEINGYASLAEDNTFLGNNIYLGLPTFSKGIRIDQTDEGTAIIDISSQDDFILRYNNEDILRITSGSIEPLKNFSQISSNGGIYVSTGRCIDADGFFQMVSSNDNTAPVNSVYFSTNQNKLVYKDNSSMVHPLY